MKNVVSKAIEIIDAEIEFVSLVDKAANKRQFLFAKSEDGPSKIKIQNKLIKSDDEHTVIGIIYEPGVEDAHGNFMKADEIKKAAEYFNTEGEGIDEQHNEIAIQDGVELVKSWVTEEEETMFGEVIKEGTWLMELKVTDDEIWKSIEDGDITGFSMGGSGTYILEDVDPVEKAEKVGLWKDLMKMLGLTSEDVIEKGEVMDRFNKQTKWDAFYNAKWALDDTLRKWIGGHYEDNEWIEGSYVFETDQAIITEALNEFSTIMNAVLADPEMLGAMIATGVSQATIEKMEVRREEQIQKEAEADMNKQETKDLIKSVLEEMKLVKKEEVETPAEPVAKTDEEVIAEAVTKALEKAFPADPEPTLEEKVAAAVTKALEEKGISKQVDTEEMIEINKSDDSQPGYMNKFNK